MMHSRLFSFLICFFSAISTVTYSQEFITHSQQTDGFGSQFQNIIATVIFAELQGKKYVYTPFTHMEHNYNADPEFIIKKEQLINFMNNFDLHAPQQINTQPNCKAFLDQNIEQCARSNALKKIKSIFRENKNKAHYFDAEHIHVAVHVRRPNSHDSRPEGSDTPDALYLEIIKKLRAYYITPTPRFHVYSQGSAANFINYHAPDIILHINEPVETTFTAMVLADVLVTSRSSLSYVAGLLSNGKIYYMPFWHKPLPEWIILSNNFFHIF